MLRQIFEQFMWAACNLNFTTLISCVTAKYAILKNADVAFPLWDKTWANEKCVGVNCKRIIKVLLRIAKKRKETKAEIIGATRCNNGSARSDRCGAMMHLSSFEFSYYNCVCRYIHEVGLYSYNRRSAHAKHSNNLHILLWSLFLRMQLFSIL